MYKQLELYRIKKVITYKKTYILKELDKTLLLKIYIRNKLKKFFLKQRVYVLKENIVLNLAFINLKDNQI